MRKTVLAIIASCILVACQKPADTLSKIGVFDLKYTLKLDTRDSLEILSMWDDIHTATTLQGNVNRHQPRLFYNYIVEGNTEIDSYWWNKYRQKGEWLAKRDTIVYKSIDELVQTYKKDINGAVIYDSRVASTSNVASAVAGCDNLIAVRYDERPNSLYQRLIKNGPKIKPKVWLVNKDGSSMFTGTGIIPGTDRLSTGSIKNDPYIWFI